MGWRGGGLPVHWADGTGDRLSSGKGATIYPPLLCGVLGMRPVAIIWPILAAAAAATGAAQAPVDSALVGYIANIKIVDNHAHPGRMRLPGMGPDTEFDALPLDGLPVPMPEMMRPAGPEYIRAWKALYGYAYSNAESAHVAVLEAERRRVMQAQGVNFPNWVLDRAGEDIMFANRVAMGPGLAPPRFRWVAFVDPLMYPLDTQGEARTPDMKALFPLTAKLFRRYEHESGVTSPPATLDEYLRTVVTPTLERMRGAARWRSSSRRAICGPSISGRLMAQLLPVRARRTPDLRRVASPTGSATRISRTISSSISRGKRAASAWPCTSI